MVNEMWLYYAIVINWVGLAILSQLYVRILQITGDVKYEGTIWWRGFWPVQRFRLTSKRSWFARAWEGIYGHGLLGAMIHKDEKGAHDDAWVEKTIVHELRHHVQQVVLGAVFYLLYGLSFVIEVLRGNKGYWDNWFEKDARAAADRWVKRGRPRIFNFGERR